MSNPLDFQRFSNFVGSIVDRKIRSVAMGITSSTGYFKALLAQASTYATTAQTGATAASTSASAADASATSTTIIYNNFTSSYLGMLSADPQRTVTGNIPNLGAFYIRSTDKHLRVATSVAGGIVTWADATVAADPASVVVAGAANFLSRTLNDGTTQTVAGKVTFQNILSVPRVTDWSSQQAAAAVDVQTMLTTITASITTETNRATAAEGTNATAIGTERTRALAAEGTLSTSISNEITRATGIEGGLRTDLTTEVNRAKAAETTLQTNITAEQTRATGVENSISAAVSSETTRATNAESNLQTNINTEKARALTAEGVVQANLNNEISRATTADNNLSSAISAETARAQGAEGTNSTAITTERNRALAAEGTLQTNINNESSRAQGAENSLGSAISSETSRAQAVEGSFASFMSQFSAGSNGNGSWETRPNGILEQRGTVYFGSSGEPVVTINFPVSFSNNGYTVSITPMIGGAGSNYDTWVQMIDNSRANNACNVQYQRGAGATNPNLDGFTWIAIGNS